MQAFHDNKIPALKCQWKVLLLSGILFFFFTFGTTAQRSPSNFASRYIRGLINDTSDVSKPQFVFYPALSFSPETNWEFGLSGLYIFYANRDTANRLSEIKAYTFYTLEKQYGFLLNHSLFSDQNKWMLLGRIRFQYFPLLYYGIGPDSQKEYLARVDARQIQIRERLLRRVSKDFYIGPALEYQQLHSVEFVTENRPALTDLPTGAEGSSNFGIGFGAMYDSRRNMLNERKAIYSEIAFMHFDKFIGSDYSFSTLISDSRIYRPVNRRDVLAAQILGQFNTGNLPFNQLSLLGGENIMRGYYLGRFRDKNLLASQVEYRFLPIPFGFTKRLGAAVFAGTGSVFNDFQALEATDFVWSAGGGLRFLVFPKKDVFSRLDVAFTKEGPGFYIFIGEAF